jgi:protein FAM32A
LGFRSHTQKETSTASNPMEIWLLSLNTYREMSSSYKHVVGGVLKLKNTSGDGAKGVKKRPKDVDKSDQKHQPISVSSPKTPSHSTPTNASTKLLSNQTARWENRDDVPVDQSGITTSSEEMDSFRKFIEESRLSRMTPAERSFHLAQKRRQWERIQKSASKSHKEKVEAFNRYLNSLSEHFDIPRVGPG